MAQLVARFHGMEEVGGSNPPSSTISGTLPTFQKMPTRFHSYPTDLEILFRGTRLLELMDDTELRELKRFLMERLSVSKETVELTARDG